jgi:hypothetical protein
MYALPQPLMIGDSQEEGRQQIALLRTQGGQKGLLVFASYTADGFHRFAALVGEIESVATAIRRVSAAFDHAALLELIDQDHETAWQNTQVPREGLLAYPAGGVDEPQYPGVRGGQADGAQALRELRRRMRANLGQQKCSRVGTAHGRDPSGGLGFGFSHLDRDNTLR